MLVGCSRCGKIHERGQCTLQSYTNFQSRGTKKSGGKGNGGRGATEQQKFRNTARWQRKRADVLKRDLYCCRVCLEEKKKLMRDHLQVHHIISIREADHLKLEDRNLITLCYWCHEVVENDKSKRSWLAHLAEIPPTI